MSVAMASAMRLLLLPAVAAALGAVFTVAPDAHGLAIDVSNISLAAPRELTFTWSRVDGAAGGAVAANVSLAADQTSARLSRFSPAQTYEIAVRDAASGATLQVARATAGRTGVAELDAAAPLVALADDASVTPTWELLVFDRNRSVVVVDREGWVVGYLEHAMGVVDAIHGAPASSADAAASDHDLVSLAAGDTLASSGFVELSPADRLVAASPNGSAFAGLSHEARADVADRAELVLSLQVRDVSIPF